VGNKCDVAHREVTTAEGQEMASRYNLQYIETSAKTNIGITETFEKLTDNILQRRHNLMRQELQQGNSNIKVQKNKKKKKAKKSKCSYL